MQSRPTAGRVMQPRVFMNRRICLAIPKRAARGTYTWHKAFTLFIYFSLIGLINVIFVVNKYPLAQMAITKVSNALFARSLLPKPLFPQATSVPLIKCYNNPQTRTGRKWDVMLGTTTPVVTRWAIGEVQRDMYPCIQICPLLASGCLEQGPKRRHDL